MTNGGLRRAPLAVLTVGVCVAGATVAWFFGLLAGGMYNMEIAPRVPAPSQPLALFSHVWGAATGLLAGALWSRLMIRYALAAERRGLAKRGAVVGLLVGVLSTVLLHAGLIAVSSRFDPILLGVGLLCGAVAGLATGAICAAACRYAVGRARAGAAQATPEHGEAAPAPGRDP